MGIVASYFWLIKPGIVTSNVLTAIGGYLMIVHLAIDWPLFVGLVVGVLLIIASACVFNNYIDRRIDAKMSRTQWRPSANGTVSIRAGLIYGSVLGAIGFATLLWLTTPLVVLLGLIAYIDYIVIYGYAKRHTVYSTLIGTICGGASLVAGYAAASGQLDWTAAWLFLLMLSWQMPHFYAIAIRRYKDYKKAGLMLLPIVKGLYRTKIEIVIYCIVFILSAALLTLTGVTGWTFMIVMSLIGLRWLQISWRGFKTKDDTAWAKQVFGFSMIIILTIPPALVLGTVLP